MRAPGARRAASQSRTPFLAAFLGAAAALACGGPTGPPAPPPGAIPPGQSIGEASIAGHVTFAGVPPVRKPIRMTSEASCHRPGSPQALGEEIVVNPDGTLRNVWVRVVSGLGGRVFAPRTEPVEMDQAGCVFTPHLVAAQTNQRVLFRNSDPVIHNVRAVAKENATFNISLSGQGRSVERFFSRPEAVRIKCDLHAWMSGFVVVNDSPFQAITGEGGAYEIAGLPAGTYEIEAWHETLGSRRQQVTLTDAERRTLSFTFAGTGKP